MYYHSLASAADNHNLDRKLLRLAKFKKLPGFLSDGRIDWLLLKPALEARMDELQDELPDFCAKSITMIARQDLKRKNKNYV